MDSPKRAQIQRLRQKPLRELGSNLSTYGLRSPASRAHSDVQPHKVDQKQRASFLKPSKLSEGAPQLSPAA